MGHRRHLLRRVRWKPRWHFNTVGESCVRQDASLRQTEASRSDTAVLVRTPNGWTFGDRLQRTGGSCVRQHGYLRQHPASKSDTAIPLRRPAGWTLDDRFQRIGNSCVRQSESLGQTSSVGILRSIVARTSCVCYDPLKDAAELRWWPLPHKPDRTKPCTGARECGWPEWNTTRACPVTAGVRMANRSVVRHVSFV